MRMRRVNTHTQLGIQLGIHQPGTSSHARSSWEPDHATDPAPETVHSSSSDVSQTVHSSTSDNIWDTQVQMWTDRPEDPGPAQDPGPSALNPPRCICVMGGRQCQFVRTHGLYCDRCIAHRCMCPCLHCEPWEDEQDRTQFTRSHSPSRSTSPDPDPPPASQSPPTTVPPQASPIPTASGVMTGMSEVNSSLRATRKHKYSMFPTFPVSHGDLSEVCCRYDLDLEREIYHSQTRLQNGREALLVDPGAHSSIMGDRFYRRVSELARKHHKVLSELQALPEQGPIGSPIKVGGVGKESQTCVDRGRLPCGLEDGSLGLFEGSIVPDSDLPGLLGNQTQRAQRVILDVGNGKYLIPGPGNVHIELPKGSKVLNLELSRSGHWMLPITHYSKLNPKDRTRLAFAMAQE